MLVLTRSEDQKIVITNEETKEKIVITIVRCSHGSTRLGISADQKYIIGRPDGKRMDKEKPKSGQVVSNIGGQATI